MARSLFGARDTCESCKSIDVRRWHREGQLVAGHSFRWSLACLGEQSGTIKVRVEEDAVVVTYGARSLLAAEWKPVEQRAKAFGHARSSDGGDWRRNVPT
jgi:hypothetical protein